MTLLRLTWQYLRKNKLLLCAIIGLQFAQVLLSLALPALNARIIDDGIMAKDTATIWQLGMLMLVATVAQITCLLGANYLGARTAMRFGKNLRERIFGQVQSFGAAEHRHFGASTLLTRTTNDVNQVQMLVLMTFTFIVTAPIMGVGGIIMALAQNVHLSIVLLVLVPVLTVIIVGMTLFMVPRFQIQQERIDRINNLLREQLTGVRVIRAFVRQDRERERFAEANSLLRRIWLILGFAWALLIPLMFFVVTVGMIVSVWYGGHLINDGSMQVGALTAYLNYLMLIMFSLMMMGMLIVMYPRAQVSAQRIQAVLNLEPRISNPQEATQAPHGSALRFVDVGVQYSGAESPILEGLNFELRPGQTLGMIGSTGSGKSTLVRLLPRLLDPSTGQITLGGVPLPQLNLFDLRNRVAYVPQKAFLFHASVAANVAASIGNEANIDRNRVLQALEIACAKEFIDALPEGIDAEVETGGTNFSGGQRQRLTIARAVYKCLLDSSGQRMSDFIVFDDSFSALDFATDAQLRANLKRELGDVGVLLVGQRLITIQDADEILVLDAGTVSARGTHDELLASSAVYQEIAASQLSVKEA